MDRSGLHHRQIAKSSDQNREEGISVEYPEYQCLPVKDESAIQLPFAGIRWLIAVGCRQFPNSSSQSFRIPSFSSPHQIPDPQPPTMWSLYV